MNNTENKKEKAVVLVSGGLDSAVALAIANEKYECIALSFDYGQRHHAELRCAVWQAQNIKAIHIVKTLDMRSVKKSALTNYNIKVPLDRTHDEMTQSIPVTYVPARNTVFLAHAAQLAEDIDATAIFIGVNAVDYSGYPDCRPEYIEAYQKMLNLATKNTTEGKTIKIYAPLIKMSKLEIVQEGLKRGVNFDKTCSCYNAKIQIISKESVDEIPNEFNIIECKKCDSCILRNEALDEVFKTQFVNNLNSHRQEEQAEI